MAVIGLQGTCGCLVIFAVMAIHVTPIDDLEPHEESTTCKCEPKVIFESGEMIIIHSAFDGREAMEELSEILFFKTIPPSN